MTAAATAHGPATDRPREAGALDAYSQIVVEVAETVRPSVASLRVTRPLRRGGRSVAGWGSAVVLSADGLLVTSAHVVAGGDGGSARLQDGADLPFEILGSDPLSDLAVLRVPADDLPAARLGDATGLQVGQLVVAVGNPLGMAGSVSAGVVSGVGRCLPANGGRTARLISGVIQTDAALHPGNSGGALADSSGHIVGINTALVGHVVGQGLGLAVPVNDATRGVIGALISIGRVRRSYLGVMGGTRPLPPRAAQATGRDSGVEVRSSVAGSPAAGCLRPEDIILAVDGFPVSDVVSLQQVLDASPIGRAVAVTVVRNGAVRDLEVTLTELDG